MINRVIVVGRITNDLELKRSASGFAYLSFTVAVDESRKDENGERKTNFIPVKVLGKLAETIEKYFKKGRMIGVDGSLQVSRFDRRDGTKGTRVEVLMSDFAFCDSGRTNDSISQDTGSSGYQSDVEPDDDNIDYEGMDLVDDDLPL